MVLLTIVTTSNPRTLYFDHAITKLSYIRLLSASIYNSWFNLKNQAEISLFNSANKKTTVRTPPPLPRYYNLDQMAKELQNVFAAEKAIQTEINTPVGGMVIYNRNMN